MHIKNGHNISKAPKFKKYVVLKHFSGAKVHDMKHCMKPTKEKPPAQIIFHIETNDLVTLIKQQTKLFTLPNLLELIKTR